MFLLCLLPLNTSSLKKALVGEQGAQAEKKKEQLAKLKFYP